MPLGIRPINRSQTPAGTEGITRREDGSSSGFSPRTDLAIKNAIDDMAGILSKISTAQTETIQKMPDELQQVVQNIMKNAFSVEQALLQGFGSSLESQRFALEQLQLFSRMLSQMGALADKGVDINFSDELKTLLTNLKNYLGEQTDAATEPVLLNKTAFELLDTKSVADLPPALKMLLTNMQMSGETLPGNLGEGETLAFLKQLVRCFMPKPPATAFGDQAPTMMRMPTNSGGLGNFGGQNTAAANMPGAVNNPGGGTFFNPGTAPANFGAGNVNQSILSPNGQPMNQFANEAETSFVPNQTETMPGVRTNRIAPPHNNAATANAANATGTTANNAPTAFNAANASNLANTANSFGNPPLPNAPNQVPGSQAPLGAGTAEQGAAKANEAAGWDNRSATLSDGERPAPSGQTQRQGESFTAAPRENFAAGSARNLPPSAQGQTNAGEPLSFSDLKNWLMRRAGQTETPPTEENLSPLQQAKTEILRQPLQNLPSTMDTMKSLADLLLKDAQLTTKDAEILQKFVNGENTVLTERDARQLQNLLRVCQQNIPASVQQAAVQQNLPDLPRLWAFMQLCDLAQIRNLSGGQLKKAGKEVGEFSNNVRRSTGGGNSVVQGKRSLNFMLPLFFGDDNVSYPSYVHVYDEDAQDQVTGEWKKETWLRICLLTDNIGAVEMVCRIHDGQELDVRLFFSDREAAQDFREYLPELRQNMRGDKLGGKLRLNELKVGAAGERRFL